MEDGVTLQTDIDRCQICNEVRRQYGESNHMVHEVQYTMSWGNHMYKQSNQVNHKYTQHTNKSLAALQLCYCDFSFFIQEYEQSNPPSGMYSRICQCHPTLFPCAKQRFVIAGDYRPMCGMMIQADYY